VDPGKRVSEFEENPNGVSAPSIDCTRTRVHNVFEFEEKPNGVSAPSIDCTRARDRNVFPLPHVDTRCLVWELARPYLELPTDSSSWTSSGTLDPKKIMQLIDELPNDIRSSLLRIAAVRNVATVDISPAATALLACNTAALLLGCSEGCKATLFYLLKYITKDSTALGHSITILREALTKQQLYKSTALDAGTDERSGKHLLTIMLNKISGSSEMSDTQAASCNLGYSAHSSTESFTYIFVHDAVAALEARMIDQVASHDDDENVDFEVKHELVGNATATVDVEVNHEVVGNATVDQKSADGGDDFNFDDDFDDDFDFDNFACFGDNVVDDAASVRDTAPTVGTGTRYKITEPDTGVERVECITQEQHYRWRGESLRSLIYYQYPCIIEVVPRLKTDDAPDDEDGSIVDGPLPPDDPSETGIDHDLTDEAGDADVRNKQNPSKQVVRRPHNSRFDFHKSHPLYETHQQRLRSKFLCPILAGGRVPAYPVAMRHNVHGENITALKKKYALYIMTLFSPWTMDDDNLWAPIDGTSWTDYCVFMAKLDGVHLSTGIAVPSSFSDRAMKETIENISRAMAPPLPTVKKWTIAYRARCCIPWNSKNRHIIGPCDYDSSLKRSGAASVDETTHNDLLHMSDDKNNEHDEAADEMARILAMVKDVKCKSDQNEIAKVKYLETTKTNLKCAFAVPPVCTTGTAATELRNTESRRIMPPVVFCENVPKLCASTLKSLCTDDNTVQAEGGNPLAALCRGSSLSTIAINHVQKLKVCDPSKNEKDGVTVDQKAALYKIAIYADAYRNAVTKGTALPTPLRMLLLGGPGVGKSYLISQVKVILHMCNIQNISCAYTGCAASVLVKARTVSSLFDIKSGIKGGHDVPLDPLDIPQLKNARTRFGESHVIIIDEVSMIGAKLLGDIHSRLCQMAVLPELQKQDFAGKSIILVGDFFQIKPVGDTALYRAVMDRMVYKTSGSSSLSPRDPVSIGTHLFLQFDLSQLVTQVRAATDMQHAEHLRFMRSPVFGQQAIPETLIKQLLCSRLSSTDTAADELLPFSDISKAWALAPVLVSTNEERDNIIELLGQKVALLLGVPLVKWRLPLKTSWYNESELDGIYASTPGAWGYFVQGAPAFVTENQNPLKGVANGTMGVMHSLVFAATESDSCSSRISAALPGDIVDLGHVVPTFVNLRLYLSSDRVASWGRDETLVQGEIVVPIGMTKYEKTSIRVHAIGRYSQSRTVPIRQTHAFEPAFSLTFHKVQGKTLERVILELSERPFTPGVDFNSLLVALSRVTSSCKLRVVGFDDDSALDYLRSIRPAQELMFWLAGFENGCGKWDINSSRAAVECAIDGGHFTEAIKACNKLKCPELCRRLVESKKAMYAAKKSSKAKYSRTSTRPTNIIDHATEIGTSVAVNPTAIAILPTYIAPGTTAVRFKTPVTTTAAVRSTASKPISVRSKVPRTNTSVAGKSKTPVTTTAAVRSTASKPISVRSKVPRTNTSVAGKSKTPVTTTAVEYERRV
jgi:PIF1-like helicase